MGGFKAPRCVWQGERDHCCRPQPVKASHVFYRRQDEMRGGEAMMSLTPCEPNSSSGPTPGFSPGFSPDSRSHSITLVQEELLIVSMRPSFMVLLHLTLSRSPLPVPSRRGLFDGLFILASGCKQPEKRRSLDRDGAVLRVKTSGMKAGCAHTDACEMPLVFLGSVQLRPWWASSATRKPA